MGRGGTGRAGGRGMLGDRRRDAHRLTGGDGLAPWWCVSLGYSPDAGKDGSTRGLVMAQRVAAAARVTPQRLEIVWRDDAGRSGLPWRWLRDHCPCAECLHPQTRQRQLDTAAIATEVAGSEATLAADGRTLEVRWTPDGHLSRYPVSWLAAFATPGEAAAAPPARTLWQASDIGERPPTAEFAAVVEDAGALREWLELIARYGFCFVHGTPPSPEDSERLARRIGYVRASIFGGFWDFTADLTHGDTAYTNLELRPHTDGTYCNDAPGLQMLHCLHFDGSGGESILVDGFRVAEELRRSTPDAFALLTEVEVPARYLEPGVHLAARHPVLRLDGRGDLVQVSFNNYDRAPFRLDDERMEAFYGAVQAFEQRLRSPRLQYRFTLTPGTALIFDNWRLLHGRRAYSGRRRLVGCYLNREDFESRLRVLREPA